MNSNYIISWVLLTFESTSFPFLTISINSFVFVLLFGSLFKHLNNYLFLISLRIFYFFIFIYFFKIELKYVSISWGIGFSIIALNISYTLPPLKALLNSTISYKIQPNDLKQYNLFYDWF